MRRFTSLAVFLLFALSLILPSGYSIGAVLLLLGGLAVLPARPWKGLDREDGRLIAAFALYFVVVAVINAVHGSRFDQYDVPLRFVLAIPPLLLLRRHPPAPAALWAGVALGGIGAGGIAIWQSVLHNLARANGYTNAIQFANISVLLALTCLAGLAWANQQKYARAWQALLLAGAALGIVASVLSLSRGSWAALLPCLAILAASRGWRLSPRAVAVLLALLMGGAVLLAAMPDGPIKQRFTLAAQETSAYFKGHNANSSVGGRLEMWRTAAIISVERPLLGWGKDGYMARKQEMVAANQADPFILDHTHAHNDYLDALVKRGLAGLLATLVLYLVPLLLFARHLKAGDTRTRPYALAGTMLVVSYLVFGLTQAFLTHNNGTMLLAFMSVILWSLLQAGRARPREEGRAGT